MTDQEPKQIRKLLYFFVVGTLLSFASILAFEAKFVLLWMRDVSMVLAAITAPGQILYTLFLSGIAGLPGEPLWLRKILSSVTNGFVYVGVVYLLSLLGVRSTKTQLVILVGLLLAFSALFLCMWEDCYRVEYWT